MSQDHRIRPPAPEKPKPPIEFAFVSPDGSRRIIEVPGMYFDTAIPLLDIPFGLFDGGGGQIRVKRWIAPR